LTDLDAAPGLLGLYAKALLPGARRRDALPDIVHTLAEQSVDIDHLARYQQVCGLRVSHVLPPTYLHVLAFPVAVAVMSDRSFPVPLVGLVHIQNVITVVRTVHVEESVAFTVRVADLRRHRSGRQFDVLVQARCADEVVWAGRSTYLHRERSGQRVDSVSRAADEGVAASSVQLRIPADIGRRYAAVSGDRNPIHLSTATARLFGFPRAIAHGMWLTARSFAVLEGRLPDGYSIDVTFKAPALLPSTVLVGTRRDDRGWSTDVRSQRSGKPHLTGVIAPI
jgi:acyl dehydratase